MTRKIQDVLDVIRQLAVQLHPELSSAVVDQDSSLERDLGLDSLARMELLTRLENRFGVRMPEQVLAIAETPRDLLRHLDKEKTSTPEVFPQETAPLVQTILCRFHTMNCSGGRGRSAPVCSRPAWSRGIQLP
jgi:acyl carrier protein